MNSCGRDGRSRVASPCASIEIRSGRGGCFARSCHSSAKYSIACCSTASRFSSEVDLGAGARVHRRDVRPVGQLPPLLEREVEQRGEHLRGQFDRHAIHPVERLAARQFVEHALRALADRAGQPLQVHRRDDRRHHLALLVVLRLVHRDEAGPADSPSACRAARCRPSSRRRSRSCWLVSTCMMSLYLVTDQYEPYMPFSHQCTGSSRRRRSKYGCQMSS